MSFRRMRQNTASDLLPSSEGLLKNNDKTEHGSRNRALFVVAMLGAALSGVSVEVIGVLYIFDFLALITAIIAAFELSNGGTSHRPYFRIGLLILAAALVFTVTDTINGIPIRDLSRGFARNAILGLSVLTWGWLIVHLQLSRALFLLAISHCSPAFAVLLDVGVTSMKVATGIAAFLKYNGGITVSIIALYFLRRNTLWCSFVCITSAGVVLYAADYRSGTILLLGSWICVSVLKLTKKWSTRVVISVGALIGICIYVSMTSVMLDQSIFEPATVERRIGSDTQRKDMVNFTWEEVKSRPFVGYGSWQNAERYGILNPTGDYVSVHSMVLLFIYEYGVFGIVIPGVFTLVALLSVPSYIRYIRVTDFGEAIALTFFLSGQAINIAAGGLNGFARNTMAASLVFSLALMVWSKKNLLFSKNGNPRGNNQAFLVRDQAA